MTIREIAVVARDNRYGLTRDAGILFTGGSMPPGSGSPSLFPESMSSGPVFWMAGKVS